MNGQNENSNDIENGVVDGIVDVAIENTDDPTVVIVEEKTIQEPSHDSATISSLIDIIERLNASIESVRLEIQNERNVNFEVLLARLGAIDVSIATIVEQQSHNVTTSVEVDENEKKGVSNKPAKRWI